MPSVFSEESVPAMKHKKYAISEKQAYPENSVILAFLMFCIKWTLL